MVPPPGSQRADAVYCYAVAYRRTAQVQHGLDARRERIIAAATAQLAESGYAGCSIAAVAQRAGVTTGTLYNHVSRKIDLVAEVFRTMATAEVAAARAAAATSAAAPEQLVAVIETFAGRALKAPRLAHALLAEPVDPVIEQLRLEFRAEFGNVLAGIVTAGVRSGELPPQDADVVAGALVGAIGAAVAEAVTAQPGNDAVGALVTFALRSVGAVQGS